MAMFEKLKNLASTSVDVMARTSGLFPPLDADHVIRNTNLLEKGKENGISNIPAQTATTQDSVELDIKTRIEELRDRYKRDYDLELDSYRARVASYTNILDIQQQSIKTEFNAKLGNIESDLINQSNSLYLEAEQLSQQGNNVRSFRQQNLLLNRLPSYPKDSLRAVMIISVLALAELALNFFLLRGTGGESIDVIIQSLLYGLINVVLPFALFANIVRYINHVNTTYVSFGYVFIAFYIIYTLFINLLIAHYRGVSMELQVEIAQTLNLVGEYNQEEILRRYLEKSFLAFTSFQNNWFGLKDLWSWFLFFGGCGLSLGAIREGYISDDHYPGYGKLHRTYVSDFEDFTEATEELIESQTKERDEAMDEFRKNIKNLEESHTRIPTIVTSAASLKERCLSALNSLDTSYNMLLKEYRQENQRHRTEPEPRYFDQEFKIDKPDLISFETGDIRDPSNVVAELRECSEKLHVIYESNIGDLKTTKDQLRVDPFKVEVN